MKTNMDTQYNKVYVKNDNYTPNEKNPNEIEIDVDYCYLTIPKEYVCIYHKLLVALSDFGESAVKDCQSSCNTKGMYIIQCWNIFQSALACYTLGLLDKADLFIKYIDAQLEIIYKGSDKNIYNGGAVLPITPDGKLKARVSCSTENIKFFVDGETNSLYQEYLNNKEYKEVYSIQDNNLIVTK